MNYQDLLIKSPIVKGKGLYLYTKNKKKYFDSTGGITGTVTLGWDNKQIHNSIKKQLDNIAHIDFKSLKDTNRDRLKKILLSKNNHKLDEIYYAGNSGAEANEGAMKLSYQYHQANGKKNKKWFISRYQSFHGSSSETVSIGDKANLKFFRVFFPKYRAKVKEHNVYRHKRSNESDKDYTNRSIKEIELKIRQIGPDNICGFIAETMMGGLVGDVPPSENYWKKIRLLCDKYNILLIFDEVGTGFRVALGGAQEIYGVEPDLSTYAKSMAAGFPIAMLAGKPEIMDFMANGKVVHGGSFNSNVMSVSATHATLKHLLTDKNFYKNLNQNGEKLIEGLKSVALKNNVQILIQGLGSVFYLSFTSADSIKNYRDHANNVNFEKYKEFAKLMLINGVRLSQNGRWHMSSAHSDEDIKKTIYAADKSFSELT